MSSNSELDADRTLVEDRTAASPNKGSKAKPKGFKAPFKGEKKLKIVQTDLKTCINGLIPAELKQVESKLDSEIREYNKKITALKRATKVAASYDQEIKTLALISKWREVCQAAMAYLLNATLLKINKMGGYKEFKLREVEKLKRQLEYQTDDGIEEQMEEVLQSEEFLHLSPEEQAEIRERLEERKADAENEKQKMLAKFDSQLANIKDEFTLEELAARLKVEYSLVYPTDSSS